MHCSPKYTLNAWFVQIHRQGNIWSSLVHRLLCMEAQEPGNKARPDVEMRLDTSLGMKLRWSGNEAGVCK